MECAGVSVSDVRDFFDGGSFSVADTGVTSSRTWRRSEGVVSCLAGRFMSVEAKDKLQRLCSPTVQGPRVDRAALEAQAVQTGSMAQWELGRRVRVCACARQNRQWLEGVRRADCWRELLQQCR